MSGRRCIIIITSPATNTVAQVGVKYPEVDVTALSTALQAAAEGVALASTLLGYDSSYLDEEFTDPIDAAHARIASEIPAVIANYENNLVDVAAIQVVIDSIAVDTWDAATGIVNAFPDVE